MSWSGSKRTLKSWQEPGESTEEEVKSPAASGMGFHFRAGGGVAMGWKGWGQGLRLGRGEEGSWSTDQHTKN